MTTSTTNGTITTNNLNCCINSNSSAWWSTAPFSDSITTTAYPWNYQTKELDDYIKNALSDAIKQSSNDKNKENKKEEKKMNIINLPKFGPITDDSVRFSPYGLAAKNKDGEYVTFNQDTNSIESVDVFAIKGNFVYSMPVALKDVMIGDMIRHQKNYCFVIDGDETTLTVIDLVTNEQRMIYPTQSPFGFNYVEKITSLINMKADKDNPFGDIGMAMMMANGDNKDILPFLLMNKGKDIDPMLLMLLNK